MPTETTEYDENRPESVTNRTLGEWLVLAEAGFARRCDDRTALDLLNVSDRQASHRSSARRGDRGLHLHSLDRRDGIPRFDLVTFLHTKSDHAGERCGDVPEIGTIGLLAVGISAAMDRSRTDTGRN
jgi:hypothetical protein